jgi:glutamine cyclotransferase
MILLTSLLGFILSSCKDSGSDPANTNSSEGSSSSTPQINYTLSRTYSHDTTSFTEGLLVYQGKIFESTGSPEELPSTRSLFGPVDLATGRIAPKVELERKKYFGEGIVYLKGKFYQLTYKNKVGFVYDAHTFKRLGEFAFPSPEGWE